VRLLPLYHPAAALYTPSTLETLRADFQRIPDLLALGPPQQPEPPEAVPEPSEAVSEPAEPMPPSDAGAQPASEAEPEPPTQAPYPAPVPDPQLGLF
jgi:DNA polymerase